MKSLLLLLGLAQAAFAADPKIYSVQHGETVLFYAKEDAKGVVTKIYPKPEMVIGKVNDKRVFTPSPDLSDPDKYYPAIANVLLVRDLKKDEANVLREFLSSTDASDLSKWKDVKFVSVPKEETKKIEAIEKSLQGAWKFVGGTVRNGKAEAEFAEADKELPFRERLEFCANGECRLDTDAKRFYWIDGKYQRLSFQKSMKPDDYTQKEEFDVERLSEKELVIRSLGVPFAPSARKAGGLGGKYEVPAIHREYRFQRVEK